MSSAILLSGLLMRVLLRRGLEEAGRWSRHACWRSEAKGERVEEQELKKGKWKG